MDINEYSSTWEEIISKAEALETAGIAMAEQQTSRKRDLEEGEIAPTSKPSPNKKAKKGDSKSQGPFFCKLHGAGQGHNTAGCKVINGEIDKLVTQKQGPKPYSQ